MSEPLVDGLTMYMHNGDNMIIRDNVMVGPSGYPFYSPSTNINYYGNIMLNIDGPIFTSMSATFSNNVFYNKEGALSGGTIQSSNNIFVMKNQVSQYGNITSLSVSKDLTQSDIMPLFVNPEERDFRLLPESPAIQAGSFGKSGNDLYGNPTLLDSDTDIGVIEYELSSQIIL